MPKHLHAAAKQTRIFFLYIVEKNLTEHLILPQLDMRAWSTKHFKQAKNEFALIMNWSLEWLFVFYNTNHGLVPALQIRLYKSPHKLYLKYWNKQIWSMTFTDSIHIKICCTTFLRSRANSSSSLLKQSFRLALKNSWSQQQNSLCAIIL